MKKSSLESPIMFLFPISMVLCSLLLILNSWACAVSPQFEDHKIVGYLTIFFSLAGSLYCTHRAVAMFDFIRKFQKELKKIREDLFK